MTTKESNLLIMNFMGLEPFEAGGEWRWNDAPFYYMGYKEKEKTIEAMAEYVKYSTSWDWLMPVVEKIENLDMADASITIEGDSCGIIYGITEKFHAACYSKIDSTLEVVVHFIQWYNNQNK